MADNPQKRAGNGIQTRNNYVSWKALGVSSQPGHAFDGLEEANGKMNGKVGAGTIS